MKKYISLILSVLMLHAFSHAPLASERAKERAEKALLASQVKAAVASLGTGKSSLVRVVLYDKTKYHGHITEIAEDHFVVADAKTGATAPIAYPEVKGIKGNNLSTGAKIGIGVAIAAAVVIIAVIISSKGSEGESPNGQIICVTSPCP
jgi:predicted small secreted protein